MNSTEPIYTTDHLHGLPDLASGTPQPLTKGARTRQHILDTALHLFKNQGYLAVSTRDLTAAAGISKGLLYRYFGSMEEILLAVIHNRTARIAAAIEALMQEEQAAAALRQFIQAYFRLITADTAYMRFRMALLLQPEIPAHIRDTIRGHIADLFTQIQSLFARHGDPAPEMAARRLMAHLDGMALHSLGYFADYPLTRMEAETLRMFLPH